MVVTMSAMVMMMMMVRAMMVMIVMMMTRWISSWRVLSSWWPSGEATLRNGPTPSDPRIG